LVLGVWQSDATPGPRQNFDLPEIPRVLFKITSGETCSSLICALYPVQPDFVR